MPSWKLSVFQRFKSCSALAPSPCPPSFQCSPRPSFDWMFDVSLLTSDLPPPLDYDYEHEHEHEWSRQFVLRHSFVIRHSGFVSFFASHFPLPTSHFSSLSPRQLERVGQSLLPTHRAPFLLRLFGCSRSDSFARGRQISLAKFHPKRNLIYHGRLQFRKTSA